MVARRVKSDWRLLGTLVVLVGLWVGGPMLLRKMSFFRMRRVEFNGLTHLSADRLVPAIGLPATASIFDPLDGIAERLEAVPGVLSVSLRRRLPGTLRIDVEEAAPVALAPGGGGAMTLVDERGRTLPFDPVVSAADLPIMPRPDSAVAGLLARVREVDPSLYASIAAAWRSEQDIVLQVDKRRYWFRPSASAEVILAVTAVAADLARKGRDYSELDGRFAGQVVVRWRDA